MKKGKKQGISGVQYDVSYDVDGEPIFIPVFSNADLKKGKGLHNINKKDIEILCPNLLPAWEQSQKSDRFVPDICRATDVYASFVKEAMGIPDMKNHPAFNSLDIVTGSDCEFDIEELSGSEYEALLEDDLDNQQNTNERQELNKINNTFKQNSTRNLIGMIEPSDIVPNTQYPESDVTHSEGNLLKNNHSQEKDIVSIPSLNKSEKITHSELNSGSSDITVNILPSIQDLEDDISHPYDGIDYSKFEIKKPNETLEQAVAEQLLCEQRIVRIISAPGEDADPKLAQEMIDLLDNVDELAECDTEDELMDDESSNKINPYNNEHRLNENSEGIYSMNHCVENDKNDEYNSSGTESAIEEEFDEDFMPDIDIVLRNISGVGTKSGRVSKKKRNKVHKLNNELFWMRSVDDQATELDSLFAIARSTKDERASIVEALKNPSKELVERLSDFIGDDIANSSDEEYKPTAPDFEAMKEMGLVLDQPKSKYNTVINNQVSKYSSNDSGDGKLYINDQPDSDNNLSENTDTDVKNQTRKTKKTNFTRPTIKKLDSTKESANKTLTNKLRGFLTKSK